MTPRERFLKTIRHDEPDRVPIDMGSNGNTGIHSICYNRLKAYLGITEGQTRVYDTMQQLAIVEKPIMDRFHIDVVNMANRFGGDAEAWKPWELLDGSRGYVPAGFNPESDGEGGYVLRDKRGNTFLKAPKGCVFYEPCYHPLAHMKSIEELEDWQPRMMSDRYLESQHTQAKWLYENTDYAIQGAFGGNIIETGQGLRGWEQFMIDMATDPEFTHALLDKLTGSYMVNIKRYLAAVGDYIQSIYMGDDLGTQTALQISLPMYREYVKPRHEAVYQYVRRNSDVAVYLHSCGAIYDVIPDLIEEGIQLLNPIQTSAKGMDPKRLKEEFGDKITLYGGGCDTQTVLQNATPAQIRAHVRERMEILKPGGGFVFTQVHNIQAEVPPENVVAMLDAAYEFGHY